MRIDGGCHCGDISYEATIEPSRVAICHCTDCQILSGSAFRTSVAASKDEFKLLTGRPKVYVKTAASGAKRVQAFCPNCGSPIYSAEPGDASMYFIRVGTVRQRADLTPRRQIWCQSKLPWLKDIDAITAFDQQPPLPR